MTRTFRRLTRTFRRLLAFTLLLTVLTASPARAQLHNAGDPCPEPTAGRIFTQEGSAGPSLVCNGTTLEVDESISTGPYARGIGTAAPKAPLHVAGEVIVGPTTGLACDANREGALRWKTTTPKCMEVCDGSSWSCVGCVGALAAFSFTDQTNRGLSTLVTSNIAPIGGINAGCTESVSVSGTGGSPEYRICSTSDCSSVVQTWTTATNTLDMQGKYLQLRATSSASYATTFTITANVGPASSNWSITTLPYDCSLSPAGTVCPDGTVYAGTSPASSTPMYVTRCDAGRTWDGSACTGTRGTYYWNDGSSPSVDSSMTNCAGPPCTATVDGRANTILLAAEDSNSGVAGVQPHQAAAYCDSLDIHGYTDWYLPSLPELDVIIRANNPDLTNGTADDNTLGDFAMTTYYWSSAEGSTSMAWAERPSDVLRSSAGKSSSLPIRCARR